MFIETTKVLKPFQYVRVSTFLLLICLKGEDEKALVSAQQWGRTLPSSRPEPGFVVEWWGRRNKSIMKSD